MMLKFAAYCPVLSIPHTEQVFGFQNAAQWAFRMRHSAALPGQDHHQGEAGFFP